MKHNQKSLILLRGIPGSGKSTFAHVIAENGKYPICSIDSYFTDNLGHYSFDFRKNHLAYKTCEDLTIAEMKKGTEKIIVDNTFTMEWEMEPYFKHAEENNYRVFVMTIENRHGGKNIHQIPEEHIQKMRDNFKVII